MTEFADLRDTISTALDKAITEHFAAKEASAKAKFKDARQQRHKKRSGSNDREQWHETYTIQVARTNRSATIKVDGAEPIWNIEEPWRNHGMFQVLENGSRETIDSGKNLESLIQRTILLALSNAYLDVLA